MIIFLYLYLTHMICMNLRAKKKILYSRISRNSTETFIDYNKEPWTHFLFGTVLSSKLIYQIWKTSFLLHFSSWPQVRLGVPSVACESWDWRYRRLNEWRRSPLDRLNFHLYSLYQITMHVKFFIGWWLCRWEHYLKSVGHGSNFSPPLNFCRTCSRLWYVTILSRER